MKRGVGEPNSQMGKSYANSTLPRANQCSPSALPRDWLAPEEGGARATRNPGPPHSSTGSYTTARASSTRRPHSSRSLGSRSAVCARVCDTDRPTLHLLYHPSPAPLPGACNQTRAMKAPFRNLRGKLRAAAKDEVAPNRNKNKPLESARALELLAARALLPAWRWLGRPLSRRVCLPGLRCPGPYPQGE